MRVERETGDGGVSAGPATIAAFGLMLVVFAVIPQTRPIALVVLWIAGPLVAFGSLGQVFLGQLGLRSAPTIVFALVCGVVAFVAIPLGFFAVSETLGGALQFFGFAAALVAVVFARVAVYDEPTATDRYVPPVEPGPEGADLGELEGSARASLESGGDADSPSTDDVDRTSRDGEPEFRAE